MPHLDIGSIQIMPPSPTMTSCGPAVLHHAASLRKSSKTIPSVLEIIKTIKTDRKGTTRKSMEKGAKYLGLKGHWSNQFSIDELYQIKVKNQKMIIISYSLRPRTIRDEHFMIFEGIEGDKIILNDPLGCLRIFEEEEFEKGWFDRESGHRENHWAMIID